MRGPTKALQHKADGLEHKVRRALDRLKGHIELFLEKDGILDDAERDKTYLRDKYIIPRMRRFGLNVQMVSETTGVRLDHFPQLSRSRDKAFEQIQELHCYYRQKLQKKYRDEKIPDFVDYEVTVVMKLNPEFVKWAKKKPEVYKHLLSEFGVTRLCPIREEKKHKGGINCEE